MGEYMERGEWESLINKVDKEYSSPQERAEKIWSLLKTKFGDDIHNWDLVCFSAWFLTFMVPELEGIAAFAKRINIIVSMIHYQATPSDLPKDKILKIIKDADDAIR